MEIPEKLKIGGHIWGVKKGINFKGGGKSPSVSTLVDGTPEQIERMKLTGSVFRKVVVDKPCIPGEVINVDEEDSLSFAAGPFSWGKFFPSHRDTEENV